MNVESLSAALPRSRVSTTKLKRSTKDSESVLTCKESKRTLPEKWTSFAGRSLTTGAATLKNKNFGVAADDLLSYHRNGRISQFDRAAIQQMNQLALASSEVPPPGEGMMRPRAAWPSLPAADARGARTRSRLAFAGRDGDECGDHAALCKSTDGDVRSVKPSYHHQGGNTPTSATSTSRSKGAARAGRRPVPLPPNFGANCGGGLRLSSGRETGSRRIGPGIVNSSSQVSSHVRLRFISPRRYPEVYRTWPWQPAHVVALCDTRPRGQLRCAALAL